MYHKAIKVAATLALTCSLATTASANGKGTDITPLIGGIVGGAIADKVSNGNAIATFLGAISGIHAVQNYQRQQYQSASVPTHRHGDPLSHRPHRNKHNAKPVRLSEHEKKILDDKILDQVGWKALNSGNRETWENPITGSWGEVRVSPMYAKGEFFCRNFESRTIRNDRVNGGSGYACKVAGSDIWTVMN